MSPEVIKAPHSKNGRLVRRNGDPSELLAACKALVAGTYAPDGLRIAPARADVEVMEAAIAKAQGSLPVANKETV